MPKVSIAIPTRNRAHYLALSLDSALQQTFRDIEVLISDNMSVDGTADLLRRVSDPRVRILRQTQDLSMVQNWNACVAAAAGEYFLLLSDDDLLEPRAIEAMVQAFEARPDSDRVGMVYALGRVIDGEGSVVQHGIGAPTQEEAPDMIVEFFNGQREPWACSILLRTEDLRPGYSDQFDLIMDAAAWIRAACKRGCARFVSEMLVQYRMHQNATNATPARVWQQENSKVAEFAIDSLRQADRSSPELERRIRKAAHRLNVRIAIALPLKAKDNSRRTVMRKYLEHLPQFASWYGGLRLARGLLIIATPRRLQQALRAAKRRRNMRRRD